MNDGAQFVVDLDVFAANLTAIRTTVFPAEPMLVVKDDAYAHGLEPIVLRAWQEGVRWIGALDVSTGVRVRDLVGSEARIFAWMINGSDDIREAVESQLECGVGTEALLEELADHPGAERIAVHLKVDTGLHRNGVRPEHWLRFVTRARAFEEQGRIRVMGIWSHIAEASDDADDEARRVFDRAVADARSVGLTPTHLHLAASAAAFARPEFRYDLVRIGAFAYGIRSTDGPSDEELGIKPIGTLQAVVRSTPAPCVAGADAVRPGPVHLACGFDALFSLAGGHLAVQTPAGPRTVLRVTADDVQCESWPAIVGERVELFGGAALESATDIAERIGTIGEEIVLRVSPHVERVYRGNR